MWRVALARESVMRSFPDRASRSPLMVFLDEVALESVMRPAPWVLFDEVPKPGAPAAPQAPAVDPHAPKSAEERAAEAARLKEFERVLKTATTGDGQPYSPASSGGSTTAGLSCHVLSFKYPKKWRPYPPEGYGDSETRIGFEYCVELVYCNDEKQGHSCACCVFRQFIKRVDEPPTSDGGGGYVLDVGEGGQSYGGGRPDSSGPGTKDTPEKEGGKYSQDGCRLTFYDNPTHAAGPWAGAGVGFELTHDFLGIVYDRCNNWAVVAAKRMILWSKGSWYKDDDGRLVVEYDDSAATTDAPPQMPKDAWTHKKPVPPGKTKKGSMPGTQVPVDPGLPPSPGDSPKPTDISPDCP